MPDLIELMQGGMVPEDEFFEENTEMDLSPGVSDDDLSSILRTRIDEAVNYAEEELATRREEEQQYYDGEIMPGDENLDSTRSKVISRDVHDTVHAVLPSVLRVFHSGKSVVAYVPNGPEDEALAEQATQYVNEVVLQQDNDGFSIFYDAYHDALTKGLGTVTWYWSPCYRVEGEQYRGITEEQYKAVVMDRNVTGLNVINQYQDVLGQTLYDCDVTYRFEDGGKVVVESVPPEERLIDKRARSIDDAEIYGRRRVLTVSEGVEMGYDYDQLVQLGGAELLDTNEEQTERYDSHIFDVSGSEIDPAMRQFEYKEVYLRVDRDGDGYAELYKIACGGNKHEILRFTDGSEAIQLVNGINCAEFCPDPVPHLATGRSLSRKVMDVQKTKTNLQRAMMDSLSRSIFPDQEVVQSQVNMDDLFNPEIGKIVRTKQPGMIREVTTTFMGKEALPVLGYMDSLKANRTGITDVTQGLDPQALQSTTASAVSAVTSAAQVQIETICRIFALKGMKRVFRGILQTIKTHQDQARTVRLRNEWVQVDPSYWNAGMDVCVNTALGKGTEQEKIATLSQIAQKQEMILQQMGPTNPLCTVAEYRNTLAEMINLAGFPNEDRFFLPTSHAQVMQQMMQERQEIMQQVQQLEQQLQIASFELKGHTAAEDGLTNAKALTERIKGLKTLVEAVQTGNEQTVGPDAISDELMVGGGFMQ